MECYQLEFDWAIGAGANIPYIGGLGRSSGSLQTIQECADGTKVGERLTGYALN
jgi:hypothetical protein